MWNKLSKPVNLETHAASTSVKKEFERVGASLNIINFKKPNKKSKNIIMFRYKFKQKPYVQKKHHFDPT